MKQTWLPNGIYSLVLILMVQSVMGFANAQTLQLKKVKSYVGPTSASVPIKYYCTNPSENSASTQHQDRSTGRSSDPRSPSPFFSARILKIDLDILESVCDTECRYAVEHAVATAFGLWRSGCSRCTSKNLSDGGASKNLNMLIINGSRWMDVITLEKWKFALDQGIQNPNIDPHRASRLSLRPLGFQPVSGFRRIEDSPTVHRLCSNMDALDAPTLLERAVCAPTARSVVCSGQSCMTLPLKLGSTSTGCKLDAGTIACGSPDGEISINVGAFKFSYVDEQLKSPVLFGAGVREIRLLYAMVHEIGHWFGMRHDNVAAEAGPINVMYDGYSSNRSWCITNWNLVQMDNATDLDWGERLSENTGLRFVD